MIGHLEDAESSMALNFRSAPQSSTGVFATTHSADLSG